MAKHAPNGVRTNIMPEPLRRDRPRSTLILLVVLIGILASACPADVDGKLRLGYEQVRVTEADGGVLIDGDGPDTYFTAYEIRPGYPLTIEATTYLEVREGTARSADTGSGGDLANDSADWKRAGVQSGNLSLGQESDCTLVQPPTCEDETCTFELEMPGDGVCLGSLTLTAADDGRTATDCWGFGWADGRGKNPERREKLTEGMVQKRDDFCRDGR